MPSLLIHELSYQEDSLLQFRKVADQPWPMFLDSCHAQGTTGRYDIFVADPVMTIVTEADSTTLADAQGVEHSGDNPLSLLRAVLSRYKTASDANLPFCGGAIGYLAYDLAARLYETFSVETDDLELPEMAVGIYGWAVVVDHHIQRTVLVGQSAIPGVKEKWAHLVELFSDNQVKGGEAGEFCALSEISTNMDIGQYQNALTQIEHYLTEGDCYQVNFAQRFTCRIRGNPLDGYAKLRSVNPAPYSAYLGFPFAQVLCSSPELFLQCHDGQVETAPIKGTRPRAVDPDRDRVLALELQHSEKDRAENLMIVDLLRNDLGKVCKPGSIRVPGLFQVESFASVHHLVSTVTGELASGKGSIDLLQACFPGGSITGAPKIRAMEVISELEPSRRNIYCGALGFIGFDGRMKTNIAIRTLVIKEQSAFYWAGGGIVIDSEWSDEYKESFDKASALFEMMGLSNKNNKL